MEIEIEKSLPKIIESFIFNHSVEKIQIWLNKTFFFKSTSSQTPDDTIFSLSFLSKKSIKVSSTSICKNSFFQFSESKIFPPSVSSFIVEKLKFLNLYNQSFLPQVVFFKPNELEQFSKEDNFTLVLDSHSSNFSFFSNLNNLSNQIIGLVQVDTTSRILNSNLIEQKNEREGDDEINFYKSISSLAELISSILINGKLEKELPKHSPIEVDIEATTVKIMNIFEYWRKTPKFDLWETMGKMKFEKQIKNFIQSNKPIAMVLPAFPFKSSNYENKVISKHVDMAEKVALDNISNFCKKVEQIYPLGVSFIIVSDGRVYCSQFKLPLENVLLFQTELKKINTSHNIKIYCLSDFFLFTPEANKRDSLMDVFGLSLVQVENRLRTDEGFNRVYCGFKHFMMEELTFPPNLSFNKRREICSIQAREMMRSNDAYGCLVECIFPEHIRLSIHPHTNVEKIGITLVPMTNNADMQWGTPWHNCALLRNNGQWELIRRNLAVQRGYILKEKEGLSYYEEIQTDLPLVQQRKGNPPSETLFIGNIPEDVTGPMLEELFSIGGKIKKLKFARSRKYAFITYQTQKQADWVIQNLNGVSFTGVILKLEYAQKSLT